MPEPVIRVMKCFEPELYSGFTEYPNHLLLMVKMNVFRLVIVTL